MVLKAIGITSLLVTLLAGCSKSPTALMERQAAVLEESAQILKEIADIKPNENDVSESPALQAKFRRLGQLQGMIDKLVRQTVAAQVPDEVRDELEDSYLERMANAAAEFHRQLARVRELNLKSGGLSDLEAVLFDES
jgi:response regulator RpfG family c-di-GMP phosphodiesterase